jgi:hypothetical protein
MWVVDHTQPCITHHTLTSHLQVTQLIWVSTQVKELVVHKVRLGEGVGGNAPDPARNRRQQIVKSHSKSELVMEALMYIMLTRNVTGSVVGQAQFCAARCRMWAYTTICMVTVAHSKQENSAASG